jgi:membrane protein DedA with SNARE-associated domain
MAEKFFNKFGAWAIFFGRCIPIVATFISIPAALARVKYWKFATFTVLGAIIWNLVLTYIGMKLGENWMTLRDKLHGFEIFIAVLIIAGIAFWVYRHLKNRK